MIAKLKAITATVVSLASCKDSPAPDPPARPPVLTYVWVIVTSDTGRGSCSPGARVEIVRGQGLGRSLTQSTLGCECWNPDFGAFEPTYGAPFDGLNAGEEFTTAREARDTHATSSHRCR